MTTMHESIENMAAEIDALGGKYGNEGTLMLCRGPGRIICADYEFDATGVELQQNFENPAGLDPDENPKEWDELTKYFERHLASSFLAIRIRAELEKLNGKKNGRPRG